MLHVITFMFYYYYINYLRLCDLDCASRVGFEAFFEDLERFYHLRNLKNVCNAGMILTFSRGLVE